MEARDWTNSLEYASDTEANIVYDEDEEYCYASGIIPKLQFRARWNDEINMAEVIEKKGRIWTTTGVVRNSNIYCSIEETLFLAEIGVLILLKDDDTTLSLNEVHERVGIGKYGYYWETFEIYKHLKSLGYIVGQHGIPWTVKRVQTKCIEGSDVTVDKSLEEESSVVKMFNGLRVNETTPLFDVYLPDSKFRKTSPGNPSFVLCSTRGYPPSKGDIEALERSCNGIPLKFCHVEHGRVSYFSFNKVELPHLP